jgi:hypothetical protein
MPPKKSSAAPSKKTEQKKKEKIIEDKTFGLKNKKGAKQQKFISQVEKQVKSGGVHPQAGLPNKKEEKEKKLKEQKELLALFKPVIVQKVDKDADPKSILCAFFKQGQCTKGDKCKFSHDLAIERKGEKKSIYVDARDGEKDNDTMDTWDENKLKEVVAQKHGSKEKSMPPTTIICKYFLEAVEKSLYGWFWECPNGTKCIYRHALPPGYVLKKDLKKDDKKEEISLYDLIETERAALGPNQTKVTLETFLAWKKRKIEEKKQAQLKEEEKKRTDFKSGKQFGISGREMFSFNPDLVNDVDDMEEDEAAFDSYIREENEEEGNFKEIDFSKLTLTNPADIENAHEQQENNQEINNADSIAGPINENLFSDECLEGLDDELEDLD